MRMLITTLALVLLSACSTESPEARLEDYASRVANAIDYPIKLELDTTIPPYPQTRDRLLEIPELREGIVEVFDLRRCGLMELIGERNSSLGKLALPSQRMLYELRFLPPLRRCIEQLKQQSERDENEDELLQRLQRIERIKREQLPRVLSNAIFNSSEMTSQFSRTHAALSMEQAQQSGALQPALQRFEQLLRLSQQPDWQLPSWSEQLEQSYAELHARPFGAPWLKSLNMLTQTLDQTAGAINARLDERPICFNNRPNNRARIIQSVLNGWYANELQPMMSALHRSGEQWRDGLEPLYTELPMSPALKEYFQATLSDHHNSLWQRYIRARDRHTAAWQRLLGQCGLMPGHSDQNDA
ncbi:DUF3080 family protein [Marinobacterium sp. MBR-109]|uniref:DUF3080 family protein n=1 Tax=Marinobacterium sp. MBR-109 TaxID=3156462 RepID=UPI003391F43E